jgi:polyhydroxyalkanoate synthesis repressor PhaR
VIAKAVIRSPIIPVPLIKRYPNRKLYDTEAKQYITLDKIAEMIQNGQDILVVDYATGEDQTALTLTQIIFELEKRQGGLLPRVMLTQLIHAGSDRINSLQKYFPSARTFFLQVDEEIKRRIKVLISQGEIPESEGQDLLTKLTSQASSSEDNNDFDSILEQYVIDRNLPTREEIELISQQLETLSEKIDGLGLSND